MTSYNLRITQWWYRPNAFQRALPGLVLLTLLACGPLQPTQEEQTPSLEMESAFLQGENGLGTNGLGTNGLSTSGLSANAMNRSEFVTWFNQNPTLADRVMAYVVRCAVAENSVRTWTNPLTGLQYRWNGSLGLTPDWASGARITEDEQQLMTACLAAHTNKYEIRVPISIQGRNADDSLIPVTTDEFTIFARQEACFFATSSRRRASCRAATGVRLPRKAVRGPAGWRSPTPPWTSASPSTTWAVAGASAPWTPVEPLTYRAPIMGRTTGR